MLKLFKALTGNPCPDGQTRYPNLKNLCGPKCPDGQEANLNSTKTGIVCCSEGGYICKNKKSPMTDQCIPSNYCSDAGLTDDQDNCACKKACSGKTPVSLPDHVDMKKNSTTGKYEPDREIICVGQLCSDSVSNEMGCDGKQGTGYCDKDQFCGNSITTCGTSCSGCIPKDWKKCDNSSNYCPPDQPCNSNGQCECPTCSKADTDNVYACTKDEDCGSDNKQSYSCYKSDPTLTDKQITKVGYCVESGTTTPGSNQPISGNCVDKEMISQKGGKLEICSPSDKVETGVNLDLQCQSALDGNCAKFGICKTNKWQANWISGGDDGYCVGSSVTPALQPCCEKEYRMIGKDGNVMCCPENVDKVVDCTSFTTEGDCKDPCTWSGGQCYGQCYNVTKYPYSPNMLYQNGDGSSCSGGCSSDEVCVKKECKDKSDWGYTDSLSCKSDDDCSKYNDILSQQLSTDSSQLTKLFCKKDDGKDTKSCYGICGYIEKDGTNSPLDVANDDANKVSWCNNVGKCTTSPAVWDNYLISGVHTCVNPDSKQNERQQYWSQPPLGSEALETSFTVGLSNCDNDEASVNACVNDLKIGGIYSIDYDKSTNQCKYKINCNSDNYKVQLDSGKIVPWNSLVSNPDNLKGTNNWLISTTGIDPTTGKINWNHWLDSGCTGNNNGFPEEAVFSPMQKLDDKCTSKPYNTLSKIKLLPDGKYCTDGIGLTTSNEVLCN